METANLFFSEAIDEIFLARLMQELGVAFGGCRRIAIKMHFGEPGNHAALTPEMIRPITGILREIGIDFFLFDSPVGYHSPRDTAKGQVRVAKDKGFDRIGPIVSDDGYVVVRGRHMKYQVCSSLADADGVLVLSHFKGHCCSGFGGAIKNLGMGALSKKTKEEMHTGGEPRIAGECIQCGACVRACPVGAIVLKDAPVFGECYGCSNCTYACPVGAIVPKLEGFDVLLADGANAAQSVFKRCYYVTFMKNIAHLCDCVSDNQGIIASDGGYLFGGDAVAMDRAAYDIILRREGKDVFLAHNKKTGLEHVRAAKDLGMGTDEYRLISL